MALVLYGSILSALTAGDASAASANVTALQAALTAGGMVTITVPGTYFVNATLTIPSNTKLSGVPGVTLKAAPSMSASILQNATRTGGGDSNIVVEDIIFDGDKANQSVAFSTVDFLIVKHFRFERCQFNGALRTGTFPTVSSDGEGLVLRQCQFGYVGRCHAQDNAYDGFKTRYCTDILFQNNTAYNNGRSGIQISYQTSNTNFSERVVVDGLTVLHDTGTPDASAPVTSGVYLHTANRCIISNVAINGVRQGVGVYENSNDNIFSNLNLRTRWTAFAAVHVEVGTGFTCNRNMFNGVTIRPLSGANGEYIRINQGGSFNRFANIWASSGDGSGTWTVQNAHADNTRNQFNDGLFSNYSLTDSGTSSVFNNWVSF
jgi:hypothetical protein